jgi:phytoene desaturase
MPQYVTELFEAAGKDYRKYFDYTTLDVICRYFWEDGTRCSTYRDHDKTVSELSECLGETPDSLSGYFARSREKYELTGRTFLEHSLHRWKTWWTKDVAKALTQLHKLDLMGTLHSVNRSYFKNPKTVQLFDRYATYNGSNPYKAPGMLSIIPHFEYGFGAYIPKEGMNQITSSIVNLLHDMHVHIHLNTRVTGILKEEQRVTGLMTSDGQKWEGDLIISNMDAYFTYLHLLDDKKKAQQVLRQERSSSALIFYWGIKKEFPELDLHNIFFSEDYKNEFDHISRGSVCDDPTVYIHITSKYIQTDAPPGCENWFTMINVPHNAGQNWDDIIERSRENIIRKISRQLGEDVASLITCEYVLDPRIIESQTFSYTGSLYGTSSNSKWAAFARHPNASPQYNNLYFVGGSVHPGGGIPLCILGARIVDELIHEK